MKMRWFGALVFVVSGCVAPVDSDTEVSESSAALEISAGHGAPEEPKLGVHFARGEAGPPSGGSVSLLKYNGGDIMQGMTVEPIFWGTSWTSGSDKVTGLGTFYAGISGTKYVHTNGEYDGPSGKYAASQPVVLNGTHIDNSPAINHAPKVSDIQPVVCKNISNPVANGYYPVYVDQPRGHANYCAWHSYGSCNGVPVQFAFFFKLDGDSGCDPRDKTPGRSQGLAALANVSGHELSEALTDPRNGGWYDSSGQENSDKCAWTFGPNLLTFSDGTQWKVQGNWSNAAYGANKGYARGCIDGNEP